VEKSARNGAVIDVLDRVRDSYNVSRLSQVAAIAVNTSDLDEAAAREAIAEAAEDTGLPADDPVRFGAGRLVDAVTTLVQS
jgi:uncharacterized NAD-dependent epimerase/dehydratase family protein